jgi:ferrochelatase
LREVVQENVMANHGIGVLLVNLGGPSSETEVAAFLRSMLSDPAVVPLPRLFRSLVAWAAAARRTPRVALRYRSIGGGSPVVQETAAQADAMTRLLGGGYEVSCAFSHSKPLVETVVEELTDRGCTRLIVAPMFPQKSGATGDAAVSRVRRAADGKVEVAELGSFAAAPGFIESLVRLASPHLPATQHLLVVAHGLPERMTKRGDPYVSEVRSSFAALAARLPAGLPLSLAYQSRLGPVRWTQPQVSDVVRRLAQQGVRKLVVLPVSFVCENLETLYDLDIELRELAQRAGITDFRRVPTPGTDPLFIKELAARVRNVAANWLPSAALWKRVADR